MTMPDFIFMLTVDDRTVPDARAVVAALGDLPISTVGFKDIGLPAEELQLLAGEIRATGRRVALEVVSLDAAAERRSAQFALDNGVELLLGGTHPEEIAPLVAGSGIAYFPFCGRVVSHPSILEGGLDEIVAHAARVGAMEGVTGVDLLAYRWRGDAARLASGVCAAVAGPVIAAGSISSADQVVALAEAGVAAITVGTAVFREAFAGPGVGLRGQLTAICQACASPGEVTRSVIEQAADKIFGRVRMTPTIAADDLETETPGTVYLKLESLQHSGSFKARGAFNTLLSSPVPAAGVIAASGGNHGAAVAYACRALGIPAEIFVPEIASPVKLQRLKAYGATVHVVPGAYAEALEASERRRAETGAIAIHAYDTPSVVAGQGTTGAEMERQIGDVDTVLVAVGGGGLIAGVASWFSGSARVIGVEPTQCASLSAALAAGGPVDVPVGGVAADALGARRAGTIAYQVACRYVDQVLTVEDADITRAQRLLWERFRVVAEPAGAAALVPLITGAYRAAPHERVCVLICGGNADLASLAA